MAVELDFGVLPGRIQALAALVDKLDPPASLEIPEDVEAPSFEELESAAEATGSVFEEAMEPAMSVLDAQLQALDEALDGATQAISRAVLRQAQRVFSRLRTP